MFSESWKKQNHLLGKFIMKNFGCTKIQEQNLLFQLQYYGYVCTFI